MHIVRWLMSHPIVSAWILAILAILLNWGVGGRSHEGMEQQAGHATEEHQAAAGGAEQHAAEGGKAAEMPATHAAEDGKAAEAEEAAPAQQAETTAGGGEGSGTAAATTEAAAEPAVASASVAEQAAVTGDTQQQVAEVAAEAETTAPAATSEGEASAEDLLRAAREAYWSGELDRSVEFYQTLIQKDAKPDFKGELANVFWKQGKSAEAVGLYAEIAPWLAEQGRMAELNSIKVYADLVDAAKGKEIGALIK
ncbi:MAG: hypothetical protein R3E95_21195 [Thiolinea sp.]